MNILGTKSEYGERDKSYFCPAVLNPGEEISLTKAIILSTFLHVAVTFALVVITAIIMFILQILGLDLGLFQKPEMKVKDIEFILVNQEAKPKNPNTRFRADRNSRAGGKHDPKKRIATPTAPTRKSSPQKKASDSQKQIEKIIHKKRAEAKQQQQQQKSQQQAQKAQSQAKPHNAPPRPAPQASMPKPSLPSMFSIPVPKNNLPKKLSGGGGGSNGMKSARPSSGGGTSGSRSPAPVMSSGGGGARGNGRHSSPYSAGSGSIGNAQGGGGAPGVDAIAEPDFGPWMRDLQGKIKRNWDPPKSEQSKRVVLVFSVAKDGRLLRVRVARSSGIPSADKAAISAVEYSAPFKPLPREFRGSDIDINFTFDYNVFGGNIR